MGIEQIDEYDRTRPPTRYLRNVKPLYAAPVPIWPTAEVVQPDEPAPAPTQLDLPAPEAKTRWHRVVSACAVAIAAGLLIAGLVDLAEWLSTQR
jgi:hypothetical protein